MHRFFLPPSFIGNDAVTFPSKTSHQIVRVLRLRQAEKVVVLDNLGWEYDVELVEVDREMVTGNIFAKRQVMSESKVKVGLYLGLTQREKFEWMLQKCTEIGASEFIPMITSRSLVQDMSEVERKRERWESILQEAAEQSGRGYIPMLHPAQAFTAALLDSARFSLKLIPWDEEKAHHIDAAIKTPFAGNPSEFSVAVLIGPEGGFSGGEIDQAMKAGLQPVTLGPRILRMETAAIVSTALIINAAE
jgi:16S rRNA (uracil1498-N3)-methyltransferase